MPDLFTQILRRLPVLMLVIGTVFPDILSRSILVLFPHSYLLYWIAAALHTPIAIILLAYIISLMFIKPERLPVFMSLILGSTLHFAFDMLQRHYVGGYMWLFPFTFMSFELPLFWPEAPITWILQLKPGWD